MGSTNDTSTSPRVSPIDMTSASSSNSEVVAAGSQGADQYQSAIDTIRANARWAMAAFAGLGSVLVASVQITGLGKLHGEHLTLAIISAAVALAGATVALGAALWVLATRSASPVELKDPRRYRSFRRRVVDDPSLLRGAGPDLDTIVDSFIDEATKANNDDPTYDPEKAGELATAVGSLTRLSLYERAMDVWSKARWLMLLGVALAAVGTISFAYWANPPKPISASKLNAFAKPVPVTVELTPATAKALGPSIGTRCRTGRGLPGLMIGGTKREPEIVLVGHHGCGPAHLLIHPPIGTVVTTNGR